MFDINYDSSLTIKKWAKIFYGFAIGFIIVAAIAALVLLCIDPDLGLIAVIVFVSSLACGFGIMFMSHLAWGFGDLIENTKKTARLLGKNSFVAATNEMVRPNAVSTKVSTGIEGRCEMCNEVSDALVEAELHTELGTLYRKACPACREAYKPEV